jgi:transposase
MPRLLSTSSETRNNALPDDLSLYIGKKTLVKLILEAVEGIDMGESRLGAVASEQVVVQPAMMLTLLTYCYAAGVYGSMDIELNIRRDQMTRYLCAKTYPDIDVLRSFRRDCRLKIKQCLTLVLRRVWELRFCGDDAEPIGGLSYVGSSLGRWSGTRPAPNFSSEAEERIARAIRADSMALDV